MIEAQACGGWPSPIGAADLAGGELRLSAPRLHEGMVFWLEGRPAEGGRQVLVAANLREHGGADSLREICPRDANVRTRVHEYGGGEYALWGDRVFFVDDRDGRVHCGRIAAGSGGVAGPVSPSGSRFADLVCSPDGSWLVAVEEAPREGAEPENRLVAFDLGPSAKDSGPRVAAPITIAAGHDFYASPVFSPDGSQLAFIAWDHPNMPWTGTWLETVEWSLDGARGQPVGRGGGQSESIFQPRYAPSGSLLAVTDRSGWWNLARFSNGDGEPLHRSRAEFGQPQWAFGQSSWAFLNERTIVASATREGLDEFVFLDVVSGEETVRPTPWCSIAGVQSDRGWVTCLGGSERHAAGIYVWRPDEASPHCVRSSSSLELADAEMSRAEPRTFELADGRRTYAFLYRPASSRARPRSGERPPLLVKSHGGPTGAASAALDPRIQYWTTRGFAVADVNYAGSTGYGRAYRDSLERAWGILDVADCVAVAEALGEEGVVDAQRLAISGGSAGGFTTLCALTFHSVFAAGASHYGIGDLEALARDTHKFESRYTDWLVGEWPAEREVYVARSPIHHHEQLSCPVIFFQGLEDRVVPPNQAEAMVEVLARRGIAHAYVPFEGEQHGFRRAENICTALEGEVYFYSRVFGFEAARPPAVHVVSAS